MTVKEERGAEEAPTSLEADGLDELARLNNELVNLQRSLFKKNQLLARLNQEKDTFLGMAAHDLRNPIAAIQGYGELLLDVELDPQQTREALSAIVQSAEYMLTLVNDLLDISVIESGKLELRRERTCLGALLRRRLEFFHAVAGKKTISLIEDLDEALEVEVDPNRYQQVIDNLVSNAIKYSPKGSRVWVTLRGDSDGVRFSVRDEGPGLSAKDQDQLFGTFSRLSATPTGGERSTGLGLAITKQIVSAHDGRIKVQSEPGHGSTFTVIQPGILDQSTRADRVGELRNILLVDDDETILALNQLALQEAGYDVRAFNRADEALAALDDSLPDLVLLDVEMPQMDGPSTLAALRADPRFVKLPVIFFTARTEGQLLDQLLGLGALAVLSKTLGPGDLPDALRRAWRRPGGRG